MRALVIVARNLSAGFLGCYGNEWIETPNVDRLAAEGIVFDQHFSDHPDPVAACLSWRTGCYHFPLAGSGPDPPSPHAHDLIQALTEHGIATALVLERGRPWVPDLTPAWRHVFLSDDAVLPETSPMDHLLQAAGDALDLLEGHNDWLLWLDVSVLLPPWNSTEEHSQPLSPEPENDQAEPDDTGETSPRAPWTGPLPERVDADDNETFARLQDRYGEKVAGLDTGIGILLSELQERALLDEVMIALTSDRGLPLGIHDVVDGVRPWLHEELVHLPLVIRWPRGAAAGWRVSELTQPVDLLPTLHQAFGLPAPSVHGRSVLPFCSQQAIAIRPYACSGLRVGESVEWSLRSSEWAFLLPVFQGVEDQPRSVQLYRKPEDRWEMNNLLQHNLELGQRLEQTLRAFVAAGSRPGPMIVPVLAIDENPANQVEPEPRSV
jgi:arylsulfatase A-like enzyme